MLRAIAVVATVVLLSVAFVMVLPAPADAKYPKNIVYAIPITITNSQSVATPRPFDQMLTVDSSAYSAYEAANLQNVEFFYASARVIPSWLESGNSNAATSSVYWLNLFMGIPAGGSITIFMGFAATTVNLFNGVAVGEAPQLSGTYAQYDNGRVVFPYYDNFVGPTLSGAWTTNSPSSDLTVNDGLTLGYPPTYATGVSGYVMSTGTFSAGYTFDTAVTSIFDVDNIGFFNLGTYIGFGPGTYQGAFIRTACGSTYPDQWSYLGGEANGGGACVGPGTENGNFFSSEGVPGIYTVSLLPGSSSIQYFNYGLGGTTQPVTTDGPSYPVSAGFVNGHGSPISVQWARIRASPPNSVMPTAAFGVIYCPGQGPGGINCP